MPLYIPSNGADAWSMYKWNDSDVDQYGYDRCWHYPHVLAWNMLDPGRGPGYSATFGINVPPTFPALSRGENPSSQCPQAPVSNLFSPFRLGRPFMFRGQFEFSNGAAKNELGVNNHMLIIYDPGGSPITYDIEMPPIVYQDPRAVAREIERQISGSAGFPAAVTCRYLDEREQPDDPLFCFQFKSYGLSIKLKRVLTLSLKNALPETLGIILNQASDTETSAALTITGGTVVHTSERIIWDTGKNREDRGPKPYLPTVFGARANFPMWFSLVDCNFDMRYSGTDAEYDTWSWGEGGGGNKLVLFWSDTLEDLVTDWLNPSKFSEGENKYTFFETRNGITMDGVYPTEDPVDPGAYAGWNVLGRAWGTDAPPQFFGHGGNYGSPLLSKVTPCRYLTANLYKWRYYAKHTGTVPGGAPTWVQDPNYVRRYVMLLIVDRSNTMGRVVMGGCPWLGTSWLPMNPPNRNWSHGMVDRSKVAQNDEGDRLANARGGTRQVRYSWGNASDLTAADQWFMTNGLLRPRRDTFGKYPELHALKTDERRVAGEAKPVLLIDPMYDPTGARRTLSSDDPLIDFQQRKTPPELEQWYQDPLQGGEDAGLDSQKYGVGTMLGYVNVTNPVSQGRRDRWAFEMTITEVPEEDG